MKKTIAFLLSAVFLMALLGCNNSRTEGSNSDIFENIYEIEYMTNEQLIELAQDLLTGLNLVSKFDVPNFLKPDDFEVEIGSDVDWEKWIQTQISVNSRNNAKKEAENFFKRYDKFHDFTIDFLGENDYYYSFRATYIQEYSVSLADGGSDGGSETQAYRYLIYKNRAVDYTSDGVPQLAKQMLNKKSVRDILDLITYFYVSDYYNYDRHKELTRVIYRQVEETDNHGGGFIYTYYFITIGINPDDLTNAEWYYSAQLGIHNTFINGKTGQISNLSSDIQRITYIPWENPFKS